ncbi:MAG: AraC family transcriptional regulator [Planctomycetales bacterium]|nr:AraC family transcriptional regulator [Planctomycetales bacterium]
MDARTITSDPLSLTLASLSWSSWQSGSAELSGPWGIEVPAGHVSFYAIRSGSCWVESVELAAPVLAEAGDVLLFPNGSAHQLRDQISSPCVHYEELLSPHRARWIAAGPTTTEPTRIVYGHLATYGANSTPLNSQLSSYVHLKAGDYDSLAQTDGLLSMIEREQRELQPGWQAIANQLVQLVFHQSLRGFVSQGLRFARPAESNTDVLVTDPVIGLVVGLLHSQPEKPWTVASLARWVNMSRSAFSERFRDVVGKPPLHYLTELRMNKACELLRGSDLGVKQIATIVGYESPSSFTNAFKRWNGVSPASYRGADIDESVEAIPVNVN